jgi:hypothetical protein
MEGILHGGRHAWIELSGDRRSIEEVIPMIYWLADEQYTATGQV